MIYYMGEIVHASVFVRYYVPRGIVRANSLKSIKSYLQQQQGITAKRATKGVKIMLTYILTWVAIYARC